MEILQNINRWTALAVLIFFCVVFQEIDSQVYNTGIPCCNCSYTIPNITAENRSIVLSGLVPKIWAKPNLALTDLGLEYGNLLIEMSKTGDSTRESNFANVASFKYLRLMPVIDQKPNLCGYAQFINASAKCFREDDSEMQSALSLYEEIMKAVNVLTAFYSRIASGCDGVKCEKSSNPQLPSAKCYKNGTVYDFKGIWDEVTDTDGLMFELKNLVTKLYKSRVYSDKFLAALSSYAMTTSGSRLYSKTNWNLIIEAINLQLSPQVKQNCCFDRLKRISDFYQLYDADIALRTKNEKNFLLANKCKN